MMQDHTFDDIITQVQKEFVIKLPKAVIKKVIVGMLRITFKALRSNNNKCSVTMDSGGPIIRFYHWIDFVELDRAYMDVDETSSKVVKGVSDKLLYWLNAKGSPRTTLRRKNSTTHFVYHDRAGLDR